MTGFGDAGLTRSCEDGGEEREKGEDQAHGDGEDNLE